MGMRIISHGHTRTITKYYLFYKWKDRCATGFSFPCEEDGELKMNEMSKLDHTIYAACEFGEYSTQVDYVGVISDISFERIPAVGECFCNEPVVLLNGKNRCSNCGAVYNQLGEQV